MNVQIVYPGLEGCRGMSAKEKPNCLSRRGFVPESFSIPEVFARQPAHVGQIQLFNNEAKVERLGIQMRFEEQELFARNGIFRTDKVRNLKPTWIFVFSLLIVYATLPLPHQEKAKDPKDRGMIGGSQGYLVYTNGKVCAERGVTENPMLVVY